MRRRHQREKNSTMWSAWSSATPGWRIWSNGQLRWDFTQCTSRGFMTAAASMAVEIWLGRSTLLVLINSLCFGADSTDLSLITFSSLNFSGWSYWLGGQHVASPSQGETERLHKCHHRHALSQSSEVSKPEMSNICRADKILITSSTSVINSILIELKVKMLVCVHFSQVLSYECTGLLHRFPHWLWRHFSLVPHPARRKGQFGCYRSQEP